MNWNIIHLIEIESTNEYAKNILTETLLPSFIYADYQTKGKGQRNNFWYSEANKNLLCTIVLPIPISVNENNYISRWISIILVDLLQKLEVPVDCIKIKWPNDIIVFTNNAYKKIAGILIENSIERNYIAKTIIGVGLNINQTDFLQLNKTATSVKLVTQQNYTVSDVVDLLLQTINRYYSLLEFHQFLSISQQYLKYLYGWHSEFLFQYQNQILKGKIIQLNDDGKILIKTHNQILYVQNKEIEFLF